MKYQAYLVTWRDSAGTPGWRPIDDREFGVVEIFSVGWLIRQSKAEVTITTSLSEGGRALDVLTIPREAITKMKRLPHYIDGAA